MENPFIRYLLSKKTVDDRCLNGAVWQALARSLPPSTARRPLKILEVGAGIGTMLQRALERELFSFAEYTLVDSDPGLVEYGLRSLQAWGRETGYQVKAQDSLLRLHKPGRGVRVVFGCHEALSYIRQADERGQWDLIIAHAFLDLLDLNEALPVLLSALAPSGLFYFTINFDGLTILEPTLDEALDDRIQALYHQTMDERIVDGHPSGDSRTGRRLFSLLRRHGGQVLAAGPSDWVVYPDPQGYPHDEAYFLHFILGTIDKALCSHPQLDPVRFKDWVQARCAQVERGELVYIAHQIDFLGKPI
jgi:SAM-dependent methyltransferase